MLMCPAFSSSTYSLPAMPSWRMRAARVVVVRSWTPTMTSVGVLHQLAALVAAARDHIRGRGAEVDRVPGRDDRAEGVAEQCEAVETERLGEQVDVAGEDLEAQRLRVDALALPLASLVDVEHAELIAERVEPGTEVRVVEPRPPVEDDEREAALSYRFDEERVAVRQPDVHDFASFERRALVREADMWKGPGETGRFPQLSRALVNSLPRSSLHRPRCPRPAAGRGRRRRTSPAGQAP